MEILKISDSVVKITLCQSEAKEYDLNDKSELDTEEMKKSFSKLLLKAKNEVGFKFAGENIVAEIFSSKDGGYEIFVSYHKAEEKMYKEKTVPEKIQRQTFLVDGLDNLLVIFSRLKNANYKGSSALYYDTVAQKYYIIIDPVSKKDLKYAFLNEYARFLRTLTVTYIDDRIIPICKENAIETLLSVL